MDILTGINAGFIKSQNGAVVAIALKVATVQMSTHLIYLPPEQLREVMFAACNCYRELQMMHHADPEKTKNQVMADSLALKENAPEIILDELQNPHMELCVTEFVLKRRENKVRFLFFLRNGDVPALELTLTQIEYVLNTLVYTVQQTEDAKLASYCLSDNDFSPFYAIDFNNNGKPGVKYQKFNVPDWKDTIYDSFYSILYIQGDGHINCGAIIKAGSELESGRAENIGMTLLQRNSYLMPYQKEVTKIDYAKLNIPGNEGSMERLIRTHIEHRNNRIS